MIKLTGTSKNIKHILRTCEHWVEISNRNTVRKPPNWRLNHKTQNHVWIKDSRLKEPDWFKKKRQVHHMKICGTQHRRYTANVQSIKCIHSWTFKIKHVIFHFQELQWRVRQSVSTQGKWGGNNEFVVKKSNGGGRAGAMAEQLRVHLSVRFLAHWGAQDCLLNPVSGGSNTFCPPQALSWHRNSHTHINKK